MAKDLEHGDKVEWETPQGKTDPRYVVESERTGKQAAHKPEALDKR